MCEKIVSREPNLVRWNVEVGESLGTTSDLSDFVLGDMVRLSGSLRSLASEARSVEDYAGLLCSQLQESFVDGDRDRQTVLVRLYLTQPLSALPEPEREFATAVAPVDDEVRCLTLLGTAGDLPEWNSRRRSAGHLAIPLRDAARVSAMPMVSGLLHQLGIDVVSLTEPAGLVLDAQEHRYGVFYVERAEASPMIPAQDFVTTHGVRSVVGFGGVLPDGEMYAVVMFARVDVPRAVAQLLETLAPSVTLAMIDLADVPVFSGQAVPPAAATTDLQRSSARESLLRGLLDVHQRVATAESDRARAESRRAASALDDARHEAEKYAALARTLQSSLIPHDLPLISGLHTAAFFRPAGDGSEVGGDFYDLFPIRRDTWGLVLGDVSGKGAGAASLTALARHTVRTAAQRAKSCVEVLRVLNTATYRQEIAEERYLTALFAFLRRRGATLEVALCLGGHELPLLLRPGQEPAAVGSVGQPLGLFSAAELSQTRFSMHRGDQLVAFTDGVIDARRGRDLFGAQRVRSSLLALAGQPIRETVDGLAAAVAAFQGDRAADDIALVGIESTR